MKDWILQPQASVNSNGRQNGKDSEMHLWNPLSCLPPRPSVTFCHLQVNLLPLPHPISQITPPSQCLAHHLDPNISGCVSAVRFHKRAMMTQTLKRHFVTRETELVKEIHIKIGEFSNYRLESFIFRDKF